MGFNREIIQDRLLNLPIDKRIAFSVSICERLYPNYLAFHSKTKWGNPELLRKLIDDIWEYLLFHSDLDNLSLDSLLNQCDKIIPDTEDFDTILVSSALDASCCVYNTLKYISNGNLMDLIDNASLAVDTVDMYVQDLLNLEYSDNDFELKISNHPFMTKELNKQSEDLSFLDNNDLSFDIISNFRKINTFVKSNIDL